MDDQTILSPGETKSDSLGCSKVSCKIINDKVVIVLNLKKINFILKTVQAVTVKESEACPAIPPDCLNENIKLDQSGCCKICISCKDNHNVTRNVGETWKKDKCSVCSCQGCLTLFYRLIYIL